MSSRKGMPKPHAIAIYWLNDCDDSINMLNYQCSLDHWIDDEFSPKSDAKYLCFVCGNMGRTERAHIQAVCDGGTNDVSNLHLLCPQCHLDSEHFDGDMYWSWVKSRSKKPYSNYNKVVLFVEMFENSDYTDINKFVSEMIINK